MGISLPREEKEPAHADCYGYPWAQSSHARTVSAIGQEKIRKEANSIQEDSAQRG